MSASRQSLDSEQREPRPATSGEALGEYRRRKLELGEAIRDAMNLASERRHDEFRDEAGKLLARLVEDRFELAVVGQFSRGKSTLMNAILGHPYLPTGALPMTSVLTNVTYGSRPRVMVRRHHDRLPIQTSLEELVRFVAQSSAEREELQVTSAEVQVPAEILRLGFHFIDTPGIGSAVAANTATTKHFLPEADAVIFVTGFDAPLSEPELEFLVEVRRHVEKLFFVVNKLDLVSPREADEVVEFVHQRLGRQADGKPARVFAVSAREALRAKRAHNREALAESQLPELEHSLVRFLTGEKAGALLLRLCARTEGLLARLRLDLELGRDGSASGSPQRSAHRTAFEQRARDLIAQEHGVRDRLLGRVAAELPEILVERSDPWTEELRTRALGEIEERSPSSDGGSSRDWVRDATAHLRDSAPGLFEPWLASRLAQARALLVALASGELDELYAMNGSVERLAAQSFGVPFEATDESAWSPADLPQLAIGRLAFDVRLELPRSWRKLSGARLESEARARLLHGVDAAVAEYSGAVRAALMLAASRWVQDIAIGIERKTRRAADRLLDHARDPASEEQVAELGNLERRLAAFRTETADWRPVAAYTPADEPLPAARTSAELKSRCVVCERLGDLPFQWMAHAQWELARRDERRAEHARAGGFCPMHTWQYAEMASEVGIALVYAPLAALAAELLDPVSQTEPSEGRLEAVLSQFMPGPDRCPACVALADAERDAVCEIVAGGRAGASVEPTPPLCVRHLAAVVATEPATERTGPLAERLARTLRRLAEDLQTYSLKRESLRRHLLIDEEEVAIIRTISSLSGHRELIRPWRRSDEIG